MWNQIEGIDLGPHYRTIELKGCRLHIDVWRICTICEKPGYSLEFKNIDNCICMNCLMEVISLVKLYSKMEENDLLKSSENLESNTDNML